MTQADIIDHFVKTTSLNRAQVKSAFEELTSLARRQVLATGEFVVPGVGKLVRLQRTARQGRNPSTGETIKIPARKTIKLRVSKSLKTAALAGDNTTNSDI